MAGKAFGKTKTVGNPVTGTDEDNVIDTSANTDSTKINGGDGKDSIIGTVAADRVNAGDGDDTVFGGAGDDILFGNDGEDTAVFSGSIVDYVWNWSKGNTLNVSGADGDDQLKHFEYLQFDDFTYSVDGNNRPLALLRSASVTEENTALVLSVDIYDFDGDAISVVSATSTRGSVVAIEDLTAIQPAAIGTSEGVQIAFDPLTDFDYLAVGDSTTETITLVVQDSAGNQTTTTFDVTVTGSNDAPTLAAGAMAADEDGAASLLDLAALGADVDSDNDGTTLTYSVTGQPAAGVASISGTTLSFDPGADFQDLADGETRDVTI
ncbi:Ig-like domain-containing protein [Tropicibacter naphthalenivorans]|nr:VCBS domain-containing protein [Tropicibacter naphthalenivorans]SMD00596.1 VCBS repeat-containing protein [Tropicibacter naphthalenivorans]